VCTQFLKFSITGTITLFLKWGRKKSDLYILVWLDNRRHNRKPNAADPYWYRLFRTNFPDWFRTISAAMGIDEQRSGTARPTRWPRDAGPAGSWPRLCNRCPPTDQLNGNQFCRNQQVSHRSEKMLGKIISPTRRVIQPCKSFNWQIKLLVRIIFFFLTVSW
jgi:hypothetical protein